MLVGGWGGWQGVATQGLFRGAILSRVVSIAYSRCSLEKEDFVKALAALPENKLLDFTRQHILHGTPKVFSGKDAEFFSFKKRICGKFAVEHTDIFIVGSAKLGFSPYKFTPFSLDSDIDLAIVSAPFFERLASVVMELEYARRRSLVFLGAQHLSRYEKFLKYHLIGWLRPDLMPYVKPCDEVKDDWFDFFKNISFGRSEVGNYSVSAGVFRSHLHLERYATESIRQASAKVKMGAVE